MKHEKIDAGLARYELSDVETLISEPTTVEDAGPREKGVTKIQADWPLIVAYEEQRLGMLRQQRLPYLQNWALISQYLQPRRSTWMTDGGLDVPVPNSAKKGLPNNQFIVDPTGTYAAQVCSAGLFSGNMHPSRPWFLLRPPFPDDRIDDDAFAWLEKLGRLVYWVMASSNFYESVAQICEDVTYFGTMPMVIYEDQQDIIRCFVSMIGEFFLAASGAYRPDTLYRTFLMNVRQMVERFGLANCPRDVQDQWQQKLLDVERIVCHAIEPNFAIRDPSGKDIGQVPGGFAFREFFWVWGVSTEYPLSVRGFREKPFIAPRWAVNGNDPYGTGCPGMVALPDVMQLMHEVRKKGELLEKLIKPPVNAPVEMKNRPTSILPGGINYSTNPQQGMTPVFQINPQAFQAITEDLNELRQRIREGFFNDLFLMVAQSKKDETAYEVAAKQQEKLQAIGPVIERFQNEIAADSIERIIQILKRRGMVPPPPNSLMGVPIQPKFVSVLALAQRAAQTAPIDNLLGLVGRMFPLYNQVRHVIDPIKTIKEYAENTGVTHRIMTPLKVLQQMIEADQKQQQQAQENAQVSEIAQHAPGLTQAVQNLSATPIGGGMSALGAALGTGAAPAGQGAAG